MLLVALNSSRRPVTLSLPVAGHLGEGTLLGDAWGQETFRVAQGQIHDVRVAARSGVVLEVLAKPGP